MDVPEDTPARGKTWRGAAATRWSVLRVPRIQPWRQRHLPDVVVTVVFGVAGKAARREDRGSGTHGRGRVGRRSKGQQDTQRCRQSHAAFSRVCYVPIKATHTEASWHGPSPASPVM
jgi:hypothetical protein